jgi:Zinc finger, C3HC4 type (RING finger)
MQTTHSNIVPSASSDKWLARLQQYNNNLPSLDRLNLNKLPYSNLQHIAEVIKQKWDQWEPHTYKLAGRIITTAKDFILHISNDKSQIKLVQLIEIANKTDSLALTKCLTDCKSFVKERHQTDQDYSKGFVDDIAGETLSELSKCISESPVDWRLLADGLGFDNLSCRELSTPSQMIEQWLLANSNSTVSRLHFEATKINMKTVCSFLDAIPLEGTSKVVLQETIPWYQPSTRQALLRFEECLEKSGFKLNWDTLAQRFCSSEVEKNKKINARDLIWMCQVPITHFLNSLEIQCKPAITQFKMERDDGIFENKSQGGISYTQIQYLAAACKKEHLQTNDPMLMLSQMLKQGDINVDVLQRSVFPSLYLHKALDFSGFLSLYWQDPSLGGSLSLRDFCVKIIHLLETARGSIPRSSYEQKACENKKTITAFKEAYNDIKQWRYYDPLLAVSNLKSDEFEGHQTVEKVDNVSKSIIEHISEEDDNTCRVCMEKEINAIILPCAHLNFCLDCLKNLTECPTCRGPITQKFKFYKT